MAQLASVTYSATVAQTEFTVTFEFVSGTHVKLEIDGVASTDFTLSGTTLTYTGPSLASGTAVRIYRVSPITLADQAVDYTSGAVLTEANLEDSRNQLLYRLQEDDDIRKLQPRGVVRVSGTPDAVIGNTSATWYEEAAQRLEFDTTADWDADNSDASRNFTLIGGNLRLTPGRWRLHVQMQLRRTGAQSGNFDWRVRDTVSGPTGVNYYTATQFQMPAQDDVRFSDAAVVEIDLDITTNVRLFCREDQASAAVSVEPGTLVYVERIGD